MGFYDGIENAERTDRLPPLVDGFYPELQVLRVEEFKGTAANGNKEYYTATLLVLTSAPGLSPVGTRAKFMQQQNGKFPDMAKASVTDFVASCLGINPQDKARKKAEINGQIVQATTLPQQPMKGYVIAGYAQTKITKERQVKIQDWTFQPVIDPATGRPKYRPVAPEHEVTPSQPTASAPMASPPAASFPGMPGAPLASPPAAMGGAYNPAAYGPPPGALAPQQPGWPIVGAPAAPQGFMPGVPPGMPGAPAFPPPGWLMHNGQYYKPGMTQTITEAQLREAMARGQA